VLHRQWILPQKILKDRLIAILGNKIHVSLKELLSLLVCQKKACPSPHQPIQTVLNRHVITLAVDKPSETVETAQSIDQS
jgi:hypothetical protein